MANELKMIYLFREAHNTKICSRNKQFLMLSQADMYIYFFTYFFTYRRNMLILSKVRINLNS